MSNSYPPIGRGGSSGSSLTVEQELTLDHIKYNVVTRRVETDVAFQTTLDSIYLGSIISMEAGGENVFWTNHESNINFFPLWTGIFDQSLPENQGSAGIFAPSARVYTPYLIQTSLTGLPETDPLTYRGSASQFIIPVNLSSHGFEVRHEALLVAGTRLHYEIHKQSFGGILIYEQHLTIIVDAPAGSLLSWWFQHPVEGFAGDEFFQTITAEAPDGTLTDLRLSADTGGNAWGTNRFRIFEDKPVAFIADEKLETGKTEWVMGDLLTNSIHWTDGQVMAWPSTVTGAEALGDYINWA